jgi:hypothetical protein
MVMDTEICSMTDKSGPRERIDATLDAKGMGNLMRQLSLERLVEITRKIKARKAKAGAVPD